MKIRSRFLLVIILIIITSLILNIIAYKNKQELKKRTENISLLGKEVTAITSFRAGARQSLLELTEYLYDRKPKSNIEYVKAVDNAKVLLENFKALSKSPEALSLVTELNDSYSVFLEKAKNLVDTKSKAYSSSEIKEFENVTNYFHSVFLKKVSTYLNRINTRLDFELKLYDSISAEMVSMTPKLTLGLALFVILILILAANSIIRRLNQLNIAIIEFELGGRATTKKLDILGNDEISKISKNFVDLTMRILEAEKQILEKQKLIVMNSKLASLGEMAAGIAHEINNPLAIISGSAGLLSKFANNPEKLEQKIDSINKSCLRISKIITGLKKFSRSAEKTEFQSHRLIDIVHEVLVLTRAKSLSSSTPVTVEETSNSLINCNEIEIEQVLINLINNAIDAVKGNSEKWVKVNLFDDGPFLILRVMDSGHGIPKEVQKNLFDPFFTTKSVGEGTGLGLSISKGILSEHNATITIIEDTPNTCFEIRFQKIEEFKNAT